MIADIVKKLIDIDNFVNGAYQATQNEAFFKTHLSLHNVMNFIEEELLKKGKINECN